MDHRLDEDGCGACDDACDEIYETCSAGNCASTHTIPLMMLVTAFSLAALWQASGVLTNLIVG